MKWSYLRRFRELTVNAEDGINVNLLFIHGQIFHVIKIDLINPISSILIVSKENVKPLKPKSLLDIV
jgi:hypothetical protein